MTSSVDVAIIGAGAYGLSLAAHLRTRGVEHRIFGRPMQAWADMSKGMFLKSFGFATSLDVPQAGHSLPEYCRARGSEDWEPIEIATFAEYGIWVQKRLVPGVENADVVSVDLSDRGFEIALATGERLFAHRAVVATGLSHYEYIPPPLSRLPPELVSHTAHHGDFSTFAGRDVTVVGAGQSALQAAALLHEHKANTRLLAREEVGWSSKMSRYRPLLERLRYPNSTLGPGRWNFILQHAPMLLHHLSDEKRVRFTRYHLGPLGAWWLRPRVDGIVHVRCGVSVVECAPEGGKARLRMVDKSGASSEIVTDHVIAGTGYDIDVDRLAFLSPPLRKRITRLERAPALSRHFESSVPGLFFVGPATAWSFGPLFRFVAGAYYAVPQLARRLDHPLRRYVRARQSGLRSSSKPAVTSL